MQQFEGGIYEVDVDVPFDAGLFEERIEGFEAGGFLDDALGAVGGDEALEEAEWER